MKFREYKDPEGLRFHPKPEHVMSRSRMKRIAAMKGEPAPTFGAAPSPSSDPANCPTCGSEARMHSRTVYANSATFVCTNEWHAHELAIPSSEALPAAREIVLTSADVTGRIRTLYDKYKFTEDDICEMEAMMDHREALCSAAPSAPAPPDYVVHTTSEGIQFCNPPLTVEESRRVQELKAARAPAPLSGSTKEWHPFVEVVRTEMMKRFSNKLSMEEIADCAYTLAGALKTAAAPSQKRGEVR